MKATIFLVCSFVCVLLAAACAVFGHTPWIAVFEKETKKNLDQDPRYPPMNLTLQEANSKLALLNAFYKVNGFAPNLREVIGDEKCQLKVDGDEIPCAAALEHQYAHNCYGACMEQYLNNSRCFELKEPSQHCWNVYAGMIDFTKSVPIKDVNAASQDFTLTQNAVYEAIRRKDPFIVNEWTKIITDRACKRSKNNISDTQLQLLGGDDCVSIRNDG